MSLCVVCDKLSSQLSGGKVLATLEPVLDEEFLATMTLALPMEPGFGGKVLATINTAFWWKGSGNSKARFWVEGSSNPGASF